MDMDITDLVLALASAIFSLVLPYGLYLLRKHTGITLAENDRRALDDLLNRGIAYGIKKAAGADGKITVEARSQIGKVALRYAVEHSPDLVERVTGAARQKLEGRIQAQLATTNPEI